MDVVTEWPPDWLLSGPAAPQWAYTHHHEHSAGDDDATRPTSGTRAGDAMYGQLHCAFAFTPPLPV